jgi:hypothetical protein
VKAPWITDHGAAVVTSLFALFVSLLCSGAFTIDSSMPTLMEKLNERPI